MAIAVFLPLYLSLALLWISDPTSDYARHLAWSSELREQGRLSNPHFLYHLLVAMLHAAVPWASAATWGYLIVPTASSVGLVLVVRLLLIPVLAKGESGLPNIVLPIALSLLGPVSLLHPASPYLGYLVPSVFHSPTYTLMQPLALLLFYEVVGVQTGRSPIFGGTPRVLTLATLTILCGLAKPSYLLALLPALALHLLVLTWTGRPAVARTLALGVVTPGAVLLFCQYLFAFPGGHLSATATGRPAGTSIVVAPLLVMSYFTPNVLAKFILSVALPAGMLLLSFRTALKNDAIRLSWLVFLVGAAETYLLAESGPFWRAGNFLWTGHSSGFVLLITHGVFLLGRVAEWAQESAADRRRWIVGAALLALHSISGLEYYVFALTAPSFGGLFLGR